MAFLSRAAFLATDETNPSEPVRYIRRRKFGQKRRSILVKRRTPMKHSLLKNDSIISNEDSYINEFIIKDDDERSQEYISRRRISTINESNKEKTIEEESETIPVAIQPTVFKQLKLDQFLKVVQSDPIVTSEETNQCHPELNNDDSQLHTRRITRHSRLHSTSPSEIETKPELNNDEGGSLLSSDESSISNTLHSPSMNNIDRPLPLKRRSLTASNIQALIDETCSPPKVSFTCRDFPSFRCTFNLHRKDCILESFSTRQQCYYRSISRRER